MTPFTAASELRLVLIVGRVAGEALPRLRVAIEETRVARGACHSPVPVREGKACGAVVIEVAPIPHCRAVAGLARGAEVAGVRIIERVTCPAVARGVAIPPAWVASLAGYVRMFAPQDEAGLPVVEERVGPARDVVAPTTGDPETAPVGVLVPVAVHAGARSLSVFRLRRMAARALREGMAPAEGEVGPRVVERLGIQSNDLCVASHVIRVTGAARRARDLRRATVQALSLLDVVRDRFVAGQTEPGLFLLPEPVVTGGAVPLELGMAGDDRPRHDEALEGSGLSLRRGAGPHA